jgi:hypothetical protein
LATASPGVESGRCSFVDPGEQLNLKDIICPVYLLAGASDDITPKEQVFGAEKLLGTPPKQICNEIAESGHIGLFMGAKSLSRKLGTDRWLAGEAISRSGEFMERPNDRQLRLALSLTHRRKPRGSAGAIDQLAIE